MDNKYMIIIFNVILFFIAGIFSYFSITNDQWDKYVMLPMFIALVITYIIHKKICENDSKERRLKVVKTPFLFETIFLFLMVKNLIYAGVILYCVVVMKNYPRNIQNSKPLWSVFPLCWLVISHCVTDIIRNYFF